MWQMIRQFLNTKQYLYYIGRHDILPPPLKGQQEKEIIEKAVSGDQKARDLLIEHNLRLVVYVAKRYDNSANCPLEDLMHNTFLRNHFLLLRYPLSFLIFL